MILNTRLFNVTANLYQKLRIASLSTAARNSNLSKLRQETGFALNLCKKALELQNNDLEAAKSYLEEEAIKHGYAKVQKLKTHRAVQGLVGLIIQEESKKCCLLEINCQTDFVSRNAKFQQLAAQLTSSLFRVETNEGISKNGLIYNSFKPDEISFFQDQISQAVILLGENIKVSRCLTLRSDRKDILLFGHTHASGDFIADINEVKLGKYGAVVVAHKVPANDRVAQSTQHANTIKEPKQMDDDQDSDFEFEEEPANYTTEEVGKILCQQVIGMSPAYLKKSPEILAKEKQLMEEGYKIPEETKYLLDQKTIINPSLSVSEFCDNHGIQILDFVRYECGETID